MLDNETQSSQEAADTVVTAPQGTQDISASEAGRILAAARSAKAATSAEPAAEPVEESASPEADAAPPEEATGETIEQPDPEETPSIEPPRSWSKDARARWEQLDPETQAYLVEQDSQTSNAVRKAQNEAAEQRKAADAELQATQQQRQQYEQALEWALTQAVQGPAAAEFADVKTTADARRLATEDPLRYTQYLAWRDEATQLAQQYQMIQQQKATEKDAEWQVFATKQDQLFAERVPEFSDPDKALKLRTGAIKTLKDVGFTEEELGKAWSAPNSLSLRDHRIQRLIVDAMKYRNAQVAVKAPQPKPVPKVVKPGVAPGKSSREAHLTAMDQQLDKSGKWQDAARLLIARRAKKA